MVEATKKMFTNYANFNGRTSRRDYWLAILGYFIISFVLGFISGLIFGTDKGVTSIVSIVFGLATIIPMLAMDVRRLHDINKSGWFLLLEFIPLVGSIILLVFACMPSVNENNNY